MNDDLKERINRQVNRRTMRQIEREGRLDTIKLIGFILIVLYVLWATAK